jgi:hypothetical protein
MLCPFLAGMPSPPWLFGKLLLLLHDLFYPSPFLMISMKTLRKVKPLWQWDSFIYQLEFLIFLPWWCTHRPHCLVYLSVLRFMWELGILLNEWMNLPCLSISASEPGPSWLLHLLFLFPPGNRYVDLTFLHFLIMRETDTHGQPAHMALLGDFLLRYWS